jgi:hypothetical protein
MILPGIFASQISGHLYSGPAGAFDALGNVTVGSGGLSSITFSAIPQTYTHLQIRGFANNTTTTTEALLQFNGDTSSGSTSYSWHTLQGNGSSASAASGTSTNGMKVHQSSTNFGGSIIDILDYTSTTKNKVVRSLNGWDGNGSGDIFLWSGSWYNQSPITSLTIGFAAAALGQYSNFSLYGIR